MKCINRNSLCRKTLFKTLPVKLSRMSLMKCHGVKGARAQIYIAAQI